MRARQMEDSRKKAIYVCVTHFGTVPVSRCRSAVSVPSGGHRKIGARFTCDAPAISLTTSFGSDSLPVVSCPLLLTRAPLRFDRQIDTLQRIYWQQFYGRQWSHFHYSNGQSLWTTANLADGPMTLVRCTLATKHRFGTGTYRPKRTRPQPPHEHGCHITRRGNSVDLPVWLPQSSVPLNCTLIRLYCHTRHFMAFLPFYYIRGGSI